ncbi:MAG: histidine phosphatase family protein [Alphaproteobacteria bacterium]|nr:histidine phosphatase family protein [Alphaproteobacteria bacterium]
MELLLIRHGLPERSAETDDPPLSAEGHDQARRVARWLAEERIDAVYASPMQRAVQTAEPFVAAAGHDLKLHEGVVEYDRGSGAYTPLEVLKREDYEAWKAFVAGGQGADIALFQRTVVPALEEIVAANSGGRVAVFCHGGVINVWTAHVLGMSPRLFFEPGYASVHRYLCARSGERNVVALNERAHLRADWPAPAQA